MAKFLKFEPTLKEDLKDKDGKVIIRAGYPLAILSTKKKEKTPKNADNE